MRLHMHVSSHVNSQGVLNGVLVCVLMSDHPEEKKEKTTSMSRTEWTKGVYLPLGRIAHLEGGGVLGWRQARLSMNGP